VNASRKADDEALLRAGLEDVCDVEPIADRALIAIQGPRSEAVLAAIAPSVTSMKFMDAGWHSVMGIDCMVSRSGYTGEDGFEISVPEGDAERVWDTLLQNPELQPIGLGARDSLRLEAGLCLYGNDIDPTTNPTPPADKNATVSTDAGHTHAAVVTGAQLAAGNAITVTLTGATTHTHTVALSQAELTQISANTRVQKTSSNDNAHTHTVTFN